MKTEQDTPGQRSREKEMSEYNHNGEPIIYTPPPMDDDEFNKIMDYHNSDEGQRAIEYANLHNKWNYPPEDKP